MKSKNKHRLRHALTGLKSALLLSLALTVAPFVNAAPVTLEMKDAEITTLIELVSSATGKNFIVDPRVKGKVTVISSRSMEGEALYRVFLSILQVHGYAAVESGKIIKIVPEVNAKQGATPVRDGPRLRGDETITRVIPIEYSNAAQLVPILRPLIPQQGHLAAHAETNVLIVSDRAANVARLEKIIRRIDQASEGEIEAIPLQHASAAEVVRILESLTKKGAAPAKGKGGQSSSSERALVADERTNTILLFADKSERLRLRALIAHLDTPVEMESEGDTQVIFLRYASAKELAPVITGVSQNIVSEQKEKSKKVETSSVTIQAHESNNALVITAPPAMQRTLHAVVRQLDVRRAQVLVEAVIAEIRSDKAAELGVQWRAMSDPNGTGGIGGTNFNITKNGINAVSANPLGVGDGLSLGYFEGTKTLLGTEFLNLGVLLRALGSDGSTNILSTPSLVMMDNQEAEIVVGQNVPFVTGSYTSAGSGSTPDNPFQTIQREDVGLTLKVKPQINEGNAIKLDIEQEVSSISTTGTSASDIITNTRSIRTSVMVEDGRVLVLGGLIDDQQRESVEKVPGLGNIPLLGHLFSYKHTTKEKRNLMVFLHPQIMRDAATETKISGSKYSLIRAQQLDLQKNGVPLMPGESAPLLPEMEQMMTLPTPYEAEADGSHQ
ncbi:type II secretion system protein GspD [Solemya pervernicosa gill symbiont]|uniref:Type II secretion system protein GspD n=1 Tax=Solemya pervernicosa gill symbiont TaxID=642797 RepID=A0A1T2L909_9GAMM|nr:type II secretion system secretin GspD [Solemya pervernicosa gill symbiont]OOZ41587.1 type II secretion system protein GspD [Solemya pervernicosa gill symbiont]